MFVQLYQAVFVIKAFL